MDVGIAAKTGFSKVESTENDGIRSASHSWVTGTNLNQVSAIGGIVSTYHSGQKDLMT